MFGLRELAGSETGLVGVPGACVLSINVSPAAVAELSIRVL